MNVDRRTFSGILVSTLCYGLGWNDPRQLPALPSGFDWTSSPSLQAHVPCPINWFHHEEDHGGGSKSAYFTRENYAELGYFRTGFVVNVVANMTFTPGGQFENLKHACLAFVLSCLEDKKPLNHFQEETESLYTLGIEKIEQPRGHQISPWRIRIVGVANKTTNSIYLVQFESPADKWDEDWQIGEQIYEMFKINRKV